MIDFIERFGSALIFVVLFLDQLGVPIPATPIVLALGALTARGAIDPLSSLAVATAGSLCASLLGFQLGRRIGARVLGLFCRISLEPDTCVSTTKDTFSRHGAKALLVAKFLPGIDILAPPLAGMLGIGRLPFVLWSTAGAILWLVTFGGVGYLLGSRIEELPALVERTGRTLGLIVVGLLAAYVGWKYLRRRQVLHGLWMARITPEELHRMILAGEDPAIVDVRSELSLQILPIAIPGALFIALEELDRRHPEIPRTRDVVLYCS